jgi:predicted component of type VI protein secretion system
MPRIFILSGPDLGKTYSFAGEVRLGRTSDCEVVVRDASISRVHAKLSPDGDAWVLEDLDSSNGIHLGSVRAKRFELTDGDVFKLGKIELRFRADEATASPAAPVEAAPAPSPAPVEPPPAPITPPPALTPPTDDEEDELFLEEDIDLGTSNESPAAPVTPPPPATPAPELKLGVGGAAPRPKSKISDERRRELQSAARGRTAEVTDRREREVLQFSTHRSEATAMTSDLSQHPIWVRALVFLLVLGVSAALFWFAFKGTSSLTSSDEIELDPGVEFEDEY